MTGARYSLGIRRYFNENAPKGFYVSMELDYLKTSYDAVLEFYDPDSNIEDSYDYETYADDISIDKQVSTLNFKGGWQMLLNHFAVDVYAGIGVRYKDVVHHGKENPDSIMDNYFEPNYDDITHQEGHIWTISIPLNVKIGYIF